MRKRVWLAVLGALLTMGARQAPEATDYLITPELSNGRLTALQIDMRMTGGPSGAATLDIPGSDTAPRPFVSDLTVEGAVVNSATGRRSTLSFTPGAAIHVRYRVLPGEDIDPSSQPIAPIVRPDWFAVYGGMAFVVPETSQPTVAHVSYGSPPAGWTLASSFEGDPPLNVLRDSELIGGSDYHIAVEGLLGSPFRVAYPDRLAGIAKPLMEKAISILKAERSFWRTHPKPFFIALVPLTDDAEFGGRGLNGGLVLYLGKKARQDEWLHLIAHENLHSWISRRIGGYPNTDDNLEAWLNEGFTEAYAARILLSATLWTPEQFAADLNGSLLRYGASPVKTAPNARIQADRDRDFDVGKLPYDRGRLLALLWDHAIRVKTGGAFTLDKVMRAQERQAALNAKAGQVISADRLFPIMVERIAHLDLSDQMARYIDRGEAISLPADLLAPCADIVMVTQPVFDRGFNLGATLTAHGRLADLEAGGPAERAGLKAGDHILIDEIPSHDSQTPLTYRIKAADGSLRTVRYKPEGLASISFQQIRLTPLAAHDPARCRAVLARP